MQWYDARNAGIFIQQLWRPIGPTTTTTLTEIPRATTVISPCQNRKGGLPSTRTNYCHESFATTNFVLPSKLTPGSYTKLLQCRNWKFNHERHTRSVSPVIAKLPAIFPAERTSSVWERFRQRLVELLVRVTLISDNRVKFKLNTSFDDERQLLVLCHALHWRYSGYFVASYWKISRTKESSLSAEIQKLAKTMESWTCWDEEPTLVIPNTGNYQIVYWFEQKCLQCLSTLDFCDGSREVAAGVETHWVKCSEYDGKDVKVTSDLSSSGEHFRELNLLLTSPWMLFRFILMPSGQCLTYRKAQGWINQTM